MMIFFVTHHEKYVLIAFRPISRRTEQDTESSFGSAGVVVNNSVKNHPAKRNESGKNSRTASKHINRLQGSTDEAPSGCKDN